MILNLKKSHIAIAALVLTAAVGYGLSSRKEQAPLFPEELTFPAFPEKGAAPGPATPQPVNNTANTANNAPGNSPGQTPSSVPNSPVRAASKNGNGSISHTIALEHASKSQWYQSIASELEAFKSTPYFDNKGVALGFGWNVGQQSKSRNSELAQSIGMDTASTDRLVAFSGVQQPTSLPSVSISPDQASQAVELMRGQFERPMRKLIPSYDRLALNERDAIVYHSYKVGPQGAAKFSTMLSALRTYSSNPTEENKLKVAATFTYKYTMNGKTYTDSRSALYLAALFTSPEAYNYLLGTSKAPANFAKVAQLSGQTIDTSRSAVDQIQDDYGRARDELISKGVPFNVILQETKTNEPQAPRPKNRAVFFGI